MTIVNLKYNKCDVRCCRGTIYGNPYVIGRDGDRNDVCDKYEEYFKKRINTDLKFRNAVLELKGKICGCWCKEPDKEIRCHLDTIKEYLDSLE